MRDIASRGVRAHGLVLGGPGSDTWILPGLLGPTYDRVNAVESYENISDIRPDAAFCLPRLPRFDFTICDLMHHWSKWTMRWSIAFSCDDGQRVPNKLRYLIFRNTAAQSSGCA